MTGWVSDGAQSGGRRGRRGPRDRHRHIPSLLPGSDFDSASRSATMPRPDH